MTTYFVNPKYGSDANDGLTPETAFATRDHALVICDVPSQTEIIINTGEVNEDMEEKEQ